MSMLEGRQKGVGVDSTVSVASLVLGIEVRLEKGGRDLILESRGRGVGANMALFKLLGGCSGGLDRERKGKAGLGLKET